MRITIRHAETLRPNGKRAAGIEVQPPLRETADTVVAELTKKEDGYSTGHERFADEAVVTRNDEEGTAFVVTPNSYNSPTSSEQVAKAIGALIDPAGAHEVVYYPPLTSQ